MKVAYVAAASLLSTLSYASPLMSFHERQAPGSYYPITGPEGGVQPRLEIRQLQQSGEMWNLFLLAMEEFEAMDQKEIDSYYQIAGIHGMPWYDWDGVAMNPGLVQPVRRGYCPHSQVLFGIWHRPYMLLFEQKLQAIAIGIADRFTGDDKAKYQDAAQKLRLPYWDWARTIPENEPMIPTAFVSEKVDVTKPDNTKAQIDNPLFDYNFHPLDSKEINGTGCVAGNPLDSHPRMCDTAQTTVRKATTDARNVSNHVELEKRYKNILKSIRSNLFSVMSRWQPFDSFSASGRCGDPDSWRSLESVHDNIHVEMAPAHMVPLGVSAFDPIFWMHHANVDRYLAIWQAIYPDDYLQGCVADSETWTIKLDDPLNVDSALTPFHMNAQGDFYTPANSRNIEDLGYTYPELANNPSNETLIAMLIREYSGPATGGSAKVKRQEGNSTTKAYLAHAQLPATGSAYSVYVFLGDVSGGAEDWTSQESFIGLASTLGRHGDMAIHSTVDVTNAVEKKIEAGETTAEGVVDYLKENLKWRLVFSDAEIPKEEIPDAKVSLVSTDVEKSTSESEFDRWTGDLNEHGDVDA